MNSKGQKAGANAASCAKFEPQTWRRSLCKNCFKTREQHGSGEAGDNSATKKDASLERNGSASNAPSAKPDNKSTKSPVENSGAATSAGHDRRVLKSRVLPVERWVYPSDAAGPAEKVLTLWAAR